MQIDRTQALEILTSQITETSSISTINQNITHDSLQLILQKIESYVKLLLRWNKSHNLIALTTADAIWGRHIVDSAQLWPYLFPTSHKDTVSHTQHLIDLGAGAGFPGMVLSIMGWPQVTLVESNQKKGLFLHEVIRHLSLSNVSVVSQRIEKMPPFKADILVARALAPLKTLLGWAYPHLDPQGKCLFHKGATWEEELTQAQKYWTMSVKPYPSITDTAGVILEINSLDRIHATKNRT